MATNKPILFLNIGWMKYYKGITQDDKIKHGGKHIKEFGYGWEIFNFLPYKGRNYGFVQVSGRINIERLSADKHDDKINNVLVIWVAKSDDLGRVVIGWYDNATVYRELQTPPVDSKRKCKGRTVKYNVTAKAKDCVLLDTDKRVLTVPSGYGAMGQSPIWYAEQITPQLKKDIARLISKGTIVNDAVRARTGVPKQMDVLKRVKIEQAAIEFTKEYYVNSGYSVVSVEEDNKGWDLQATRNRRTIFIEVKGLSMDEIRAELTPNEYTKMKEYKNRYRLCIVNNALTKNKQLHIFTFNFDTNYWEDEMGRRLSINKRTSAIISVDD